MLALAEWEFFLWKKTSDNRHGTGILVRSMNEGLEIDGKE
jgi:hypothetical protein